MEADDDEARDMADEKPAPRHRCGWPAYYGCRHCMNVDDEDQEPLADALIAAATGEQPQ